MQNEDSASVEEQTEQVETIASDNNRLDSAVVSPADKMNEESKTENNTDTNMTTVDQPEALPSEQGTSTPHANGEDGEDELYNRCTEAGELDDEEQSDDFDPDDPDQVDKFKFKKFLKNAAKKILPKDKEKVAYSHVIPEDEWQYPNKSVLRDQSVPYDRNSTHNNKYSRQHSLTKSLENPVPFNDPALEPSINRSSKDSTKIHSRSPDPYPCQTNVQFHLDPRSPRSKVRPSTEDQYDFTHPERGYMVVIVNDRFKLQPKRDGAHWDLLKSKELSRKLGFRLFNYGKERNLTQQETLLLLRRVQQADHSMCDCFMFMISTHGLEKPNARAKGKMDHALVCADDNMIFTSSILEMFNDENCPSLKNKPKMFIIQACRGDQLDHGSDVFVAYPKRSVDVTDVMRLPLASAESDQRCQSRGSLRKNQSVDEVDTKTGPGSWTMNDPPRTTTPSYYVPKVKTNSKTYSHLTSASSQHINKIYAPSPYAIVDTPSLRCDNDMLVMYAIPEGMFAWRNTSDGSWMIDYLHQVIMAYDMRKPKNLLSLLTKVSSIMSRRTTNTPSSKHMDQKKAIPVIEHKLLKDVIFQQKVVGSDWIK